jgi:hypothetical protein
VADIKKLPPQIKKLGVRIDWIGFGCLVSEDRSQRTDDRP